MRGMDREFMKDLLNLMIVVKEKKSVSFTFVFFTSFFIIGIYNKFYVIGFRL